MNVVHSQVGRDLLGAVAVRLRRVDPAPVGRYQPAVAVSGVRAAHLPTSCPIKKHTGTLLKYRLNHFRVGLPML